MTNQSLLKVEDLCTYFRLSKPYPFAPEHTVFAVDGVSFEVARGKTFGLVGESGCGKSTTAFSILRLVEPTSGSITFDGIDLQGLGPKQLRQVRRRMQIIFQDPYSSLNPRARTGTIVGAPLKIQKIGSSRERANRVAELFNLVGLQQEQQAAFPHQFSGGQRQRISIARALASQPDLIVCDEPVSALDVAIQAQILNLLHRLQMELNLTYLFISHDMAVVQHICDDIAVMYLGKIVEQSDRRSLFKQPLHPYTQALLSAVPKIKLDVNDRRERVHLGGDPPSPINPPHGCRFHPRCASAKTECRGELPILKEILPGHWVACHLVQPEDSTPNQDTP